MLQHLKLKCKKITKDCRRHTSWWSWESLCDFCHISNHSLNSITLSLDLKTHSQCTSATCN